MATAPRVALACALSLAIGAGAARWGFGPGVPAAAASATVAPDVDALELSAADIVAVLERQWQAALPVSGGLVARQRATVSARVDAEVRSTPVAEGMAVRAGQTVLLLDDDDASARVAVQRAARREALARLELATRQHESSIGLLARQYIAQNAFDTTRSNVELAQAALSSVDAQLDIARRALANVTVRAPYAGIISKRMVQQGEKVALGTPLFTLVDLDHLVLEVAVPGADIGRIRSGQKVLFQVDGYRERSFEGRVGRVNPEAEAGSRAMIVYVDVDNRDQVLRAGMFAKGSIALAPTAPSLLVPTSALRKQGAAWVVYRIEGTQIVAQVVHAGAHHEEEGLTEIRAGLQAGARIIGIKLDGVKPGTRVKLPAEPPRGA
ncbi:MAG: efflux RND transporter periplasmic adaptor subunit [Pseudomonadota bacterium]